MKIYNKMTEYEKAVRKKLKKLGYDDEQIEVEIDRIINKKIMEPEEKVEETPVEEEKVDSEEEEA